LFVNLVEVAGLLDLTNRIGGFPVQRARKVGAEFSDGVERERVQLAGSSARISATSSASRGGAC
jgi:hypothetical protein